MKAAELGKIPDGLDVQEATALPLVTVTGEQLISVGTGAKEGDTMLVAGAAGNVGRSAVFAAKERGAKVIAGILRHQLNEAKSIGADEAIVLDDDEAFKELEAVDAVANTVGGKTAEKLLGKVKDGGVFASVLGAPGDAAERPMARIVPVYEKPDVRAMVSLAEAVTTGKLARPISRKMALRDAGEAQALVERGVVKGKVLLLP